MSNRILSELEKSIGESLQKLEDSGDLVITTSNKAPIVSSIISSMRNTYEGMYGDGAFSQQEIEAIHSLIFLAINDQKFFDWEKPTLTGFSKEEFEQLVGKLRDLS